MENNTTGIQLKFISKWGAMAKSEDIPFQLTSVTLHWEEQPLPTAGSKNCNILPLRSHLFEQSNNINKTEHLKKEPDGNFEFGGIVNGQFYLL